MGGTFVHDTPGYDQEIWHTCEQNIREEYSLIQLKNTALFAKRCVSFYREKYRKFSERFWGTLHLATHWEIEAAIENATSIQQELAGIKLSDILTVLSATMDEFCSEENYRTMVQLTGSSYQFVSSAMNEMKKWCRDGLYYLPTHCFSESSYVKPTASVFTILPGNSEQVLPYVVCQILMSRNALILRTSSRGASAFAANQFILSFNTAIRKLLRPDLAILKKAISVLHTDRDFPPGRCFFLELRYFRQ